MSNSVLEASVPTNPASSKMANGLALVDSTGEPPRSAIPVINGVAIVQVWSMSGGATTSPNRVVAARAASVYTGLWSSKAATQ